MSIEEMNQITIDGALNVLVDDIGHIKECRKMYDNINNDYFKEAKQQLEIFLFRAYELKYFVLKYDRDVDSRKFLTNNQYYDEVMLQINHELDSIAGEKLYKEALEYIKAQDYDQAGVCFRKAALCGDLNGQYNYGVTLMNGEGCEPDSFEAAFWYWKAAKQGNSKAMMNLGILYRNGTGVKESGVQMLYWYASSAETLRCPQAVYNLGLSLKHEEVIAGNERLGRLFIQASDNLEDELAGSFVRDKAKVIKNMLAEHVYNI